VFFGLLLGLAGPAPAAPTARQDTAEVPAAWGRLLYSLLGTEPGNNPVVAARKIGYIGVALYEAVVPGVPGGRSLAGQLNDLPPLPPATKPKGKNPYHWPTVANSALARATVAFFASADAIDELEQTFAAGFQATVAPDVFQRSVERGRAVADAVVSWSSGDGAGGLAACNAAFDPPAGPGTWIPTPPGFQPAPLQPCWGTLRPLALRSGGDCLAPPPTAYSEDPASAFHAEASEVYEGVNGLTPEQAQIALFWADSPGETGTPPGHWVMIAVQVAEQYELSLAETAEALARVGIAVADAFISCWHTKYVYYLLRPVTYIQDVIDPSWVPFVATPAFPEYTSGHSVQSAAAAGALTAMLGPLSFVDDTHADDLGLAPRAFDSFEQAAREAAISRLYGGIHFRPAIETGLEQGTCVAGKIFRRLRFRGR
jgi:hypothetical protein